MLRTRIAHLAILALLLTPVATRAASTGERHPTSTTAVGSGFNNAVNALACDDVSADAKNNRIQDYHVYGFAIPSGYTITGIEVRVRATDTTASTHRLEVALSWNGGTSFTAVKQTPAFPANAPLTNYLLGGSSDLWGRSWTDSELSDANFRLRVDSVLGSPVNPDYLDCIPVTVYYTAPAPTATYTNTPPATSTATSTATFSATPSSTNTPPATATATSSFTPTYTDTPEPTATFTNSAIPTTTDTPAPTDTATPEPTATDTAEPTSTDTPAPTSTDTPEPTATDTASPEPTATDTAEPTSTDTPAPTGTDTPEPTATDTAEPTSTDTPAPTSTDTPEPTATDTASPEPTATDTAEPTSTDTAEPTSTDTPEATATDTASPEPTATASDTPEPTSTGTATDTPVDTETPTPVDTATTTPTATETPIPTATATPLPACGDGRLDAGEACDDGNTAGGDGCGATCGVEACHSCTGEPSLCAPRPPLASCRHTTIDRGSVLGVKDATADRKDKLIWKLRAAEATTKADFGNPTVDADYSFCVYDQVAGNDVLTLWHRVPAGTHWTELRRGFKYVDATISRDGIRAIRLKEGVEGKAKVRIYGAGLGLDLPRAGLPLAQSARVTAQLSNGSVCWEAAFTTNRKNSSSRFKAVSSQ